MHYYDVYVYVECNLVHLPVKNCTLNYVRIVITCNDVAFGHCEPYLAGKGNAPKIRGIGNLGGRDKKATP